jgi:hypothetical protein
VTSTLRGVPPPRRLQVSRAGVTQLAECLLPKPTVSCPSPVLDPLFYAALLLRVLGAARRVSPGSAVFKSRRRSWVNSLGTDWLDKSEYVRLHASHAEEKAG